jgi:hypothetical protein
MQTDRQIEDVNESAATTTKKQYHSPRLKSLGEVHGLVQAGSGGGSDGSHENYSLS